MRKNSDIFLTTFYTIPMPKRSIAVVLTVKNEATALPGLFDALERQTHLPDEVIITIAASQDETAQVAQSWKPASIKVVVEERVALTRSQGRNLGVKSAQSEIILFTDAGCLPESTWIEHICEPFQQKGVKLVSGLTWVRAENAWAEAQAPFVLVPPTQIETHPLPATRNMAILKDTFVKAGGFQDNLNFAEDFEFSRRLRAQKISAEFVPTAVVWWQPRSSFGAYFQMIRKLTLGDMQAQTWRFGHFSMIGRYFIFFILPFFFSRWLSLPEAIALSSSVYLFYLVLKTARFSFLNWKSYGWAPLLQLLTDVAVLVGIFQSLLTKQTKGKHISP
jgi:cellulose synthase/poly-beta-1,6-N-acetylglucosamine synthase-like glycosyltransferase